MSNYEYKVVPAPKRAAKIKSAKSGDDRFAQTVETAINEMARGGWEFQRSESLPCDERKGLFSRETIVHTVLVFRRELTETSSAARSLSAVDATAKKKAPSEPQIAAKPSHIGRDEPRLEHAADDSED